MTRDEVRERFLSAIAERLASEKVVEVHLFPTIKQGSTESAVAVIAAADNDSRADEYEDRAAEYETAAENETAAASSVAAAAEYRRLTVYTARYRLTLKGPERGKWEFAIQVEADAPLVTVDKVVRGVQRRSGDAEDPARLGGDEFRAMIPQRVPPQAPPASPPPGEASA
jgi:hypothetical protein